MSEPTVQYDAGQQPATLLPMPPPGALSPDLWLAYLARRREALIMELRALDRALGRPQTIPERQR